jgi:hypothetical protein
VDIKIKGVRPERIYIVSYIIQDLQEGKDNDNSYTSGNKLTHVCPIRKLSNLVRYKALYSLILLLKTINTEGILKA